MSYSNRDLKPGPKRKKTKAALIREDERRRNRRKALKELRRRQEIQKGLITQEAPRHYDPAIAQRICDRYADGEPFLSIIATINYPTPGQFYRWVEEIPHVARAWEAARRARAHVKAEETLDIADSSVKGHPSYIPGHALRVRARQWYAGKLRPDVYGEKLDLNHSGQLSLLALSKELRTVEPPELLDHKSGQPLEVDE